MKYNTIYCLLLLIFLSNACKKEQPQEKIVFDIYDRGLQKYGSLTALKNGIKWEASGVTGFYLQMVDANRSDFAGYTYLDNDYNNPYQVEHMSFSMMPHTVGRYKLRSFSTVFKEGEATFLYGYDEDDVTVNPFELIPEADNFVEVTKIDSLHIEGRFDVTCRGKYKIKGVTHIYRFSEGKFNVLFRK
jgi:hypothetical protein